MFSEPFFEPLSLRSRVSVLTRATLYRSCICLWICVKTLFSLPQVYSSSSLGCVLLKTRSGLVELCRHNEAKPNVRRTDRLRRTLKSSKNIISLWWRLAAKQTKSDGVNARIHACMSEGYSDQHSYDGRQLSIATKYPLKYFYLFL